MGLENSNFFMKIDGRGSQVEAFEDDGGIKNDENPSYGDESKMLNISC